MEKIRVGDRILATDWPTDDSLTGPLVFADVVSVPHPFNTIHR